MQPSSEGRIQGQLANTYNEGITLVLDLRDFNTYEVQNHLKFPIFDVVVDPKTLYGKQIYSLVLIQEFKKML